MKATAGSSRLQCVDVTMLLDQQCKASVTIIPWITIQNHATRLNTAAQGDFGVRCGCPPVLNLCRITACVIESARSEWPLVAAGKHRQSSFRVVECSDKQIDASVIVLYAGRVHQQSL